MDKNINRIKAALADKLENPIESGPLFPHIADPRLTFPFI